MELPRGIDMTDPELYKNGIPHELFARLRADSPVWWKPQAPGVAGFQDEGYWVVSTHALVQEVSRDSATYSSWENTATARYDDNVPRPFIDFNRQIMSNMDPPEHTAQRRIISRGFTPRAVGRLREGLAARAEKIVGQALEAGEGDFVSQIAAELPLQAITDLVGIPQEDRHRVFNWSNVPTGRDAPDIVGDPATAIGEVMEYSFGLAVDRRACPGEDIATTLVRAQDEDGALTDEQFGFFMVLLMVAGSDTTRNAITHGLMAFQGHPEQWRRYCRDRLLILYASANFDETVFADPLSFDIDRDPNPHLGFGGTGAHYCMGASLARMEIELIYEALAEWIPDITAVGPAKRLNSAWMNSVKSLPVRYGECPV